ncbi:MAG: RluA family pseudouridine synthase [Planctomycetes bacterium]|nr:RluA family pseudouridine synthase [Planctomycetota bacterium]
MQATAVVERYLSGTRVDTFLARHLRSYTSWRIHRLVRAGQVTVNGIVAAPDQRVFSGESVSVNLLEPPDILMPAEEMPLDLLFEDQWLMVINKPAGLIVHPTGKTPSGTLTNAAQYYLDQQSEFPGQKKPGIVHRLDRETSGAIVIAKDHLSHRLLSIEFQRERISKAYTALVDGVVQDDAGTIDLPIGRSRGESTALMTCRADAIDAKSSKTNYSVIERFPQHTLIRAKPRTGRLHQIRVHMATIGHPVVGDEFYASRGELKPDRTPNTPPASPYISRQALHAAEISFSHPMTQHWHTFVAPLPDDIVQAIKLVRSLPPSPVKSEPVN